MNWVLEIVPIRSMPVVPRGIVRAPGGTEFGDCGTLFDELGDGGDCVAPWENAGRAAARNRIGVEARTNLSMMITFDGWVSTQLWACSAQPLPTRADASGYANVRLIAQGARAAAVAAGDPGFQPGSGRGLGPLVGTAQERGAGECRNGDRQPRDPGPASPHLPQHGCFAKS